MLFSKSSPKLVIFRENTKKNFQILSNISTFAPNMAGIYIHIPFCRSRCIYCAFYSTTRLEQRRCYVDALCREMEMRGKSVERIDTVYLGGGTPSQLTLGQLKQLFLYINKVYSLPSIQGEGGAEPEITIEANPDDVTDSFAATLLQLGINRVSMGVQTFSEDRLRFLNRRHTAAQATEAVGILRRAGIRNISIDLMYGFPDESLDDWQHDIDCALRLGVEHISAYCLAIEEGTALYEKVKNRTIRSEDEETERQMYYTLIDRLEAAGYEHYEISNFARRGFRSRHNSSYWTGVPYLGLGAAAHSYDGQHRSWNVSDIHRYIDGIENGTRDYEYETIDDITRYNDRVMLALRTADGLDLATLTDSDRAYLLSLASKYLDQGLLCLSQDRLRLTRQGLFVSDMVISDLMQV